jgi:hypothetical protein
MSAVKRIKASSLLLPTLAPLIASPNQRRPWYTVTLGEKRVMRAVKKIDKKKTTTSRWSRVKTVLTFLCPSLVRFVLYGLETVICHALFQSALRFGFDYTTSDFFAFSFPHRL